MRNASADSSLNMLWK